MSFSLIDEPVVDLSGAQSSLGLQLFLGLFLQNLTDCSPHKKEELTDGYGHTRFLLHHSFKITVASTGNFPFFFRPHISWYNSMISS